MRWAATQSIPVSPTTQPERSAAPRRSVLLVDVSSDSQVHAAPPVLLSGCECVIAQSPEAALAHLERIKPLMTLVDARIFDTFPGEDPLARVRRHPSHMGTPVVLLASTDTPTELVEGAWRAGAADCVLRPLSLPLVQERVAVLTATTVAVPTAAERRAGRVVLVVDPDHDYRDALERMLGLAGYRLLLARNEVEAATRLGLHNAPVDAVLLRGMGAGSAPLLQRMRGLPGLRESRALLVLPKGFLLAGSAGGGVELLEHECAEPADVLARLELVLGRGGRELRAHEAVPFFCPVQYREMGREERWHSCYSHDVSPGGLFLRTLAPARVGAALELRIYLTTTGELLEGSGVVTWANPWASSSALRAPSGMGIQFLGMSPKRLGRLREICSAAMF